MAGRGAQANLDNALRVEILSNPAELTDAVTTMVVTKSTFTVRDTDTAEAKATVLREALKQIRKLSIYAQKNNIKFPGVRAIVTVGGRLSF